MMKKIKIERKLMEDTLPKLIIHNYQKFGRKKIAMRNKEYGIWRSYTWKDIYEKTKWCCLGLVKIGLKRGDKLCIIGDNEPQWYWSELAVQAAGGAAIGIFVDASSEEIKYIINHSDCKYVIVRDQEQVDKVLSVINDLTNLKKIIYWDNKGMWSYSDPILLNFDKVLEMGREYEEKDKSFYENSIAKGKGNDLAVICYTSGTTGKPKGAMVSYDNLIKTVSAWLECDPCLEGDNYVSFVSPAWAAEQLFGITGSLVSGAIVNFPEEPETANSDLREIGPSMVLYSSRLWESLSAQIQAKMSEAGLFKRIPYKLCLPMAYKKADYDFDKRPMPLFWHIAWKIADKLVFRPLRDKIGLLHTKSPYSGGSSLSPDTFRFFRALGVNLRQIYGASEVGLISCQTANDVKFETVGKPLPGFEVKISDNGEIMVKGDCVFPGYYKNPEETKKIVHNGWYSTGDAGNIDKDGHIVFIDRMADLMELQDGTKYSPAYIEGRLKFSPFIRDCIVIGKEFVCAVIQIDFDITSKWAENRHIGFTTFANLSQKQEVINLVKKDIIRINAALPELARVKKMVVLNKEFDPDEAELTRSRKLRRAYVTTKYEELLTAVREGKNEFILKTEVVYQDGRKSQTSAPVRIASIS